MRAAGPCSRDSEPYRVHRRTTLRSRPAPSASSADDHRPKSDRSTELSCARVGPADLADCAAAAPADGRHRHCARVRSSGPACQFSGISSAGGRRRSARNLERVAEPEQVEDHGHCHSHRGYSRWPLSLFQNSGAPAVGDETASDVAAKTGMGLAQAPVAEVSAAVERATQDGPGFMVRVSRPLSEQRRMRASPYGTSAAGEAP